MDESNNGNNINTTGAEKEKQKEEKQKKEQNTNQIEKQKKTVKRIRKIKDILSTYPIIIKILIAILIFLICWGIIGFFLTLPGTYIETIKEFGQNLWADIVGYFTGDSATAHVTREDQIELAQHLQDMGYDVIGYGFADASYEYDDEENSDKIDGFTNDTITDISTLSDNRNYLQAYIAQNEATYVLAEWNVLGAINAGGPLSILGWLTGNEPIPEEEVQAFSEGLINITGVTRDTEATSYLPEEYQRQMERLGIDVSIDRENELMKIVSSRAGIASSPFAPRTTYYFDLTNWTSLYGKPLELFLSLHLGTLMPDLAYEFATSEAFNTKVNINLQEVQSTFKVIIVNEDETEISQDDIMRIYLSTVCNMTDEQINNFANAGKLTEAFDSILSSITNIRNDYLDLTDNGTIDLTLTPEEVGTSSGFNLTEIERNILGEEISKNLNVEVITSHEPASNYLGGDEEVVISHTEDFDKYIRVRSFNNPSDAQNIQSSLQNTSLSGFTNEQVDALRQLIQDGAREANTYLPRIESVTKHWFYNDIEYQYGTAGRAKKRVQYMVEDDDSPLSEENLNGASIILDTTYTNATGVFYQLAEPEVTGPNEAIKTLFKGGTVTVDGETYTFPGEYYRYDGTRLTAAKIANAKAYDEGKTSYTFQGREINEVHNPNEDGEWEIYKQKVTFATEDENGNKNYNDAYTAFSILENVHSLEAETVYRLFKELVIELQYFTREDFMKPLTQVLLWPVERVGSDTEEGDNAVDIATAGIYKKENQYGLFLENGVAVNNGDTIIAPGDATIESVDANTIKLKFKTISDGNAQALQEKFGTDYFDVEREIVLDMEMTITGITPNVSAGQSVSAGSVIGHATGDDMRIIMYNIDKSIVEDIETYMYPTYDATGEGIFETLGEGE